MSDGLPDDGAWGFAPPPFRPAAAAESLRRSLRELGLRERGDQFEWDAKPAVRLRVEADALALQVVRRLLRTPEWDTLSVRSSAEQRKHLDDIKKRLARWKDDE